MPSENPRQSDTVAWRAACHFGVQDEPRQSIKTGRYSCLLVLEREPGRRVLAVYDNGRGSYLSLTDEQRAALLEALGDSGDA